MRLVVSLVALSLAVIGCTVDSENPARTCSDTMPCGSGQRCDRGFCVELDGGPRDAGTDGGPCTPTTDTCTVPGAFGACAEGLLCMEGQCAPTRQPAAEDTICNDVDDDCDGIGDDVEFSFATSNTHCGGCNNTCGTGNICCDGQCVDTNRSAENCLGCGTACTEGAEPACCGGCVDLATDHDNCGVCGRVCGDTETCCGGACVDLESSASDCGTCGMACSTGQACCRGTCAAPSDVVCQTCAMTCTSGTSCCQGSCVDFSSDPDHCGMACPGTDCAVGDLCCGGACVPNDTANCGSCGNACDAGDLCCGGVCVDPMARTSCGGCGVSCTGLTPDCCGAAGCTDLDTDEDHCGTCANACTAGQHCDDGRCCGTGLTNCGGSSCVNLETDNANCGGCGVPCSGLLMGCRGGDCVFLG